ncbi:MAG: hypothetical protein ACXWEY_12065 [Bacteroidia bacterium]
MKKGVFIIGVLLVLAFSNYFAGIINIFTGDLMASYKYETQNEEFEFIAIPAKGRDIEMMKRQFAAFKTENPELKDLKIYRTFIRNPLRFWKWYEYLTNEKYNYDYKKD